MTNLECFEKLAEEKTQESQRNGHDDKFEVTYTTSMCNIALIKHTFRQSVSYEICVMDIHGGLHLVVVRSFHYEENAIDAFKAITSSYI